MYTTEELYTENQIKKQIQQCRTNMMYNFSKTYNNDRRGDINGYDDLAEVVEDGSGPWTRLTVEDDEDEWMESTCLHRQSNRCKNLPHYCVVVSM